MDKYENIQFITPKCHTHYYTYFSRKKLLPKIVIFLENVSAKISAFHDKLEAIGWQYFALDSCIANEQWVRKFYSDINKVSFLDPSSVTIKI